MQASKKLFKAVYSDLIGFSKTRIVLYNLSEHPIQIKEVYQVNLTQSR